MDEIKIGAEIVFNITGSHNIGYAKWERYIGTVLSRDHRSRLYVRTIGMPRACIDERDVEWVIDPDGDFDNYSWWMTNERMMSEVTYAEGDIHIIVHECMEDYVDNVKFGEGFYKNKGE